MSHANTPTTCAFPSEWPSDCPPDDTVEAEGVVFRIVKNDPPSADDFASHFETGRLPKAPPCLRCGLSVFRQLHDAVHQRQLIPKLGSLVASATLRAEHGKTKRTQGAQPSHTTWWVYQEVSRASLFSIVEEEN